MAEFATEKGSLFSVAPYIRRVRFHFSDPGFFLVSTDQGASALQMFIRVFPAMMARYLRVECLVVEADKRGWLGDRSQLFELGIDHSMVEGIRQSLATAFRTLDLELLTDLRLSLSCAYDSTPSMELSRMRHARD